MYHKKDSKIMRNNKPYIGSTLFPEKNEMLFV